MPALTIRVKRWRARSSASSRLTGGFAPGVAGRCAAPNRPRVLGVSGTRDDGGRDVLAEARVLVELGIAERHHTDPFIIDFARPVDDAPDAGASQEPVIAYVRCSRHANSRSAAR